MATNGVQATARHCEVCFDALLMEFRNGNTKTVHPFPDVFW